MLINGLNLLYNYRLLREWMISDPQEDIPVLFVLWVSRLKNDNRIGTFRKTPHLRHKREPGLKVALKFSAESKKSFRQKYKNIFYENMRDFNEHLLNKVETRGNITPIENLIKFFSGRGLCDLPRIIRREAFVDTLFKLFHEPKLLEVANDIENDAFVDSIKSLMAADDWFFSYF